MTSLLCPICKREKSTPEFRPFCSKRCADIDLGKWISGDYAVPSTEEPGQENATEDDETA